jgi:hypothetical protein
MNSSEPYDEGQPFQAQWLLQKHFNIKKHWSPSSVFVRYCICILLVVIISLNSIKQCVLVTMTSRVYCEVGTNCLYIIETTFVLQRINNDHLVFWSIQRMDETNY